VVLWKDAKMNIRFSNWERYLLELLLVNVFSSSKLKESGICDGKNKLC
jgi:hypothetical protein